MATHLEKLDDPRVERFLRDRLGDARWKVEDAKAKLSQIMQKAKDGEAQLIGKRNPVLVIGLDELEDLMIGFREPETWGEYFYPAVGADDAGVDLVMPRGRRSAPLAVDTGPDAEAGAGTNDVVSLDYRELQLTRDYARFGDTDAAAGILQEALESIRQVRSSPAHYAAGLGSAEQRDAPPTAPPGELSAELDGFLAAHPVGSKVEGRVTGIDGCWITIAIGAFLGMAYARPASVAHLAAGRAVEAYIVGPNRKDNTVALSLGKTPGRGAADAAPGETPRSD